MLIKTGSKIYYGKLGRFQAHPQVMINLFTLKFLSQDDRCKTFSYLNQTKLTAMNIMLEVIYKDRFPYIWPFVCLQIKKLFQVSKTHTLSFRYTNVTANGRLKCKTGSKLRRSAFTLWNCKAVDFSSAFVPVVLLQSFPSSFFL